MQMSETNDLNNLLFKKRVTNVDKNCSIMPVNLKRYHKTTKS